jgi:hypothetical protein
MTEPRQVSGAARAPAATLATAEPPADTFGADLQREYRRLFSRPYEDLSTVFINGALVCIIWLLVPASTRDNAFALPASLAFAVVLESWMLSDTPATNMLAKDKERSVAVLGDREHMQRLLRAKGVALASVIAPVCAVVALVLASLNGEFAAGLALAVALLVLPFAAVAVSASLGIWLPYHPRPVRWRWANRRPWRRTIRWIVLIFTPYIYVPMLAAVALAPALLIGLAVGGYTEDHSITTAGLVTSACLVIALSAVVFAYGPRAMAALAARREDALTSYLADPDRG